MPLGSEVSTHETGVAGGGTERDPPRPDTQGRPPSPKPLDTTTHLDISGVGGLHQLKAVIKLIHRA